MMRMRTVRFLSMLALWSVVTASPISLAETNHVGGGAAAAAGGDRQLQQQEATSTSSSSPDTYCLTLHDDLMRRQSDEWGRGVDGPYTIDDGTKHTPYVTNFDATTRQATVVVGNGDQVGGVYHPMVASDNPALVHFITFIYAVDQNGDVFAVQTMDPTIAAPATAIFTVPEGVTEMTAYEFCNLHGLWKGPTISTTTNTTTTTTTTTRTSSNMSSTCTIDSPLTVSYDSFGADLIRRQSLPPFNTLEPFTEDQGVKHVPYTTIHTNNQTATVTVGVEGNYHVMQAATSSSDEVHWITDIFVLDQNGDIVLMEFLNPSRVDIAQITFDIPSTATTLTAYEFCNIHGLYVGPTVSVETGERLEGVPTPALPGVPQDRPTEGTADADNGGVSSSYSSLALSGSGTLLMVTLATTLLV